MKVVVTARELGDEVFNDAHWSLFRDKNTDRMDVKEQIAGWREKFHANITGGHFNTESTSNKWNTKDAVVEFDSEADYLLFILNWG